MIELNAILAVLMAEALICLVVLVLSYFIVNANKKTKQHLAADKLIKKIKKTTLERSENLADLVAEHCVIEPEVQQQLLEDINTQERTLYQQIIRLFLGRDAALLNKIDSSIRGLSEPYCKMLETSANNDTAGVSATELNTANQKAIQLQEENTRLSEQLHTALATMDEISSEYTRIFNGTKSETELQNSCKKMLQTYRDAESQVKASHLEQGISDS